MPETDLADVGGDLDEDLLEVEPSDALDTDPLEIDSGATTQPDWDTVEATSAAPATAKAGASPALRSDEVELSEEDLAALDTSDLDLAAEPFEEGDSLFDTSGAELSDPESQN